MTLARQLAVGISAAHVSGGSSGSIGGGGPGPGPSGDRYSTLINAQNADAYWRLGESSGVVAVDETGGNDGVYTGGFTLDQTGLIADSGNASILLNGVDASVEVPNAVIQFNGNAAFTIEAWVRFDSLVGNQPIYTEFFNGSNVSIALSHLASTGRVILNKSPSTGAFLSGATVIQTGQLYHIVYAEDTTTRTLYINAVIDGQDNTPEVYTGSSPSFARIGRSAAADRLNGGIDEVSIYNYRMSHLQVATRYKAGLSSIAAANAYNSLVVSESDIVNLWRLDETSGTNIVDSIGGADGTITGTYTLGVAGIIKDSNDGAIDFVGGAVEIPSAPLGVSDVTGFAVEVWVTVNPGGLGPNMEMWDQRNTDGSGANGLFRINSNGSIQFDKFPPSAQMLLTTYRIAEGERVHLIFSQNGINRQIYINGNLEASDANAEVYTGTDMVRAAIGAIALISPTLDFNGVMHQVALYSQPLTQQQAQNHYYMGIVEVAGTPDNTYRDLILSHSDLAAYYRLDRVYGTGVIDETGNFNATASGVFERGVIGLIENADGRGLDLLGGYVDIPGAPAGLSDMDVFSVETWVTLHEGSLTNGVNLYTQAEGSTNTNLAIRIDNAGVLTMDKFPPSAQFFTAPTVFVENKRYQIVYTENGATRTFYVDGVQVAQDGSSEVYTGGDMTASRIGSSALTPGTASNYVVDDTSIYTGELTSGEVAAHYAAGIAA